MNTCVHIISFSSIKPRASILPLKDGHAWIRIGTRSKSTHNNPVGSHVPTISFTTQVTTLVCDPTCGCGMKKVRNITEFLRPEVAADD